MPPSCSLCFFFFLESILNVTLFLTSLWSLLRCHVLREALPMHTVSNCHRPPTHETIPASLPPFPTAFFSNSIQYLTYCTFYLFHLLCFTSIECRLPKSRYFGLMYSLLYLGCLEQCLVKSLQSCLTLCKSMDCSPSARLLCPRDSPGKNAGVGCRALLQGIFLTQELNPCLWHLPSLAGAFLTISATWEACLAHNNPQ